MCVHTSVQCSFFWFIMLFCTSCGMHFARLFHLFLTRADVQTHACHTVTASSSVRNLLHLVHMVRACYLLIAADIIIPLSRVRGLHPDTLLIRWAAPLKRTMGHIANAHVHVHNYVHRTCAPCISTVGSCVGAYSSKVCWHMYHTSFMLCWHLFYCHAAYGLFEARFFYFVCCLDNTSSHRTSFRDIYLITHFL